LANKESFKDMIFSDESRVALNSDARWVWRRRGDYADSVFIDKVKHAPAVMIYAAIGIGYKSKLVICHDTVDTSAYCQNIITSQMIEDLAGRDYVFLIFPFRKLENE
jgi:hypothetical protein